MVSSSQAEAVDLTNISELPGAVASASLGVDSGGADASSEGVCVCVCVCVCDIIHISRYNEVVVMHVLE